MQPYRVETTLLDERREKYPRVVGRETAGRMGAARNQVVEVFESSDVERVVTGMWVIDDVG